MFHNSLLLNPDLYYALGCCLLDCFASDSFHSLPYGGAQKHLRQTTLSGIIGSMTHCQRRFESGSFMAV